MSPDTDLPIRQSAGLIVYSDNFKELTVRDVNNLDGQYAYANRGGVPKIAPNREKGCVPIVYFPDTLKVRSVLDDRDIPFYDLSEGG